MKQSEEVVLVERLEHIHLTARQQRPYHLERWVFRRCAYQRDDSPLHRPEQRVLLRLAKTVYFVDEEYGRRTVEETTLLRPFYHFTHILHATGDRAQSVERSFKTVCDNLRQSGLTHTRRSPKDKRRDTPCVNHVAQDGTLAHQMLLADILVQSAGSHSFCQRLTHIPCKIMKYMRDTQKFYMKNL